MPILPAFSVDFVSRSPDQTRRLGMRMGALLRRGDVLCLEGDLGSGKTTFVQGLAQGWGSVDAVTSPTFVLVNQYRRLDGGLMHHLDAYRLESAAEAVDLDLDAMLNEGVLVVEWADRITEVLPAENLVVRFSWVNEEQRSLLFLPIGESYKKMLDEFKRMAFGG
ncbi:MAG TPA: tRNA (adenosine(37)-N6)-threonylcarbamoyltransferase complex ATPase subunit type 1 TsaE [Anaerolineaceae bacterium]|nr:tRNA (adenosine(37)-N6)-threonylcarbamoyltransferase complex ATPase subunit type 1 TsaE [Anaerolineaceae bacterium]